MGRPGNNPSCACATQHCPWRVGLRAEMGCPDREDILVRLGPWPHQHLVGLAQEKWCSGATWFETPHGSIHHTAKCEPRTGLAQVRALSDITDPIRAPSRQSTCNLSIGIQRSFLHSRFSGGLPIRILSSPLALLPRKGDEEIRPTTRLSPGRVKQARCRENS